MDGERSERLLLVAVALASVLVPLNTTMLVVALPNLLEDLDAGLGAGGWLFTIYLVTMGSLQPITGKIGDRLGPRRVMLAGLTGFFLASVACAVAPNVGFLIGARAFQGVAGAMTMPNGTGMLRRLIPQTRLGARMGTVGAAITGGAAVGPVAGGLIVGVTGWRGVFLVNVPLIAAILVLVVRAVPDLPGTPAPVADDDGRGAVGRVIGGITSLFRRRGYAAGVGGIALGNLSMYVTLVAMPVLLGRREQWTSATIGLALGSLSFTSLLLAPIGGRLGDRVGPRVPSTLGMVITVAGMAALVLGARDFVLVAALAVAGAGFGLAFSSFQLAALASVPHEQAGTAAGVMSTCRYAGSITGTTLLSGALAPQGTHFRPVFVMTLAAAVGAVLLAALLPPRVVPEEEAEIVEVAEDAALIVP